jgi:hypothetical protein
MCSGGKLHISKKHLQRFKTQLIHFTEIIACMLNKHQQGATYPVSEKGL